MGRGIGLIELRAVQPGDRPQVGGKAAHLGRLTQAGLPVPPGFVIPVGVFRGVLVSAGLAPLARQVTAGTDQASALRGAIADLVVPEALSTAWTEAARALGGAVAVRSSGVDEDGAHRSFAGQHLTVLAVPPEEVPAAVLRCWASLYAEAALDYRGGGPGPGIGQMAVVVQQMVDPQCSGVLFTINPLNGSWREMVIEAVWGLGEGLVSGQIAPHWYLLRRPRQLPRPFRRVVERVRLQVVEEDLPPLTERFVGTVGGEVVREATPADLRDRRTLGGPAVRRLGRLGLRIERLFGAPQDIEWVRDQDGGFRVLQARPITTMAPPRGEDTLWTRRFIGERWPQPATPLGWSVLEPILSWFVAYPETQSRYLGGGPALKLVNGRPYINATVFRHLAFKLPGAPPPRFMLELVPPDEEQAWRRRFAVAPDLAVYGSILGRTLIERRWRRFRWNPFTNPERWADYREALEADLPVLRRVPVDTADALRLVDAQLDRVRDYVGIHICSLLFANISWQLLESVLATWLPEQRGLMEDLAVCPPGNLTVATNEALHDLAAQAEVGDLDHLAAGRPTSAAFAVALTAFLDRFGHRSESSWELMSPRWRHHPDRLVPLLRAQGPRPAEPDEARHAEALATLRRSVSRPRLEVVERLVRDTRRYLLLRENQRFWFDHLLDAMQGTMQWIGGHGVAAGWLADPADIALLAFDEIRQLLNGADLDVADRIDRRRRQAIADAAVDPPTFLVGDGPVPMAASGRLQGLGISAGRVRGPVRILRSLADGHRLRPGDILVAHAVDPGWTPLFPTVAGVILELGSVLSHGAVLAREYQIPAVVNLDDATRRLRDGQEVTVDGHRGVVWVH